ncbi:MAG: amino acid-binding protein [Acidimicrobiia bacterium]
MPWDLTVVLENRPGTLAQAGEALGAAGVNLEGGCGFPCEEGTAVFHLLLEDAAAAGRALEDAGIQVREEREVLVFDVEDRPGEVGRSARRMANAGVNIDLFYVATATRVVFGVDDLDKARSAM